MGLHREPSKVLHITACQLDSLWREGPRKTPALRWQPRVSGNTRATALQLSCSSRAAVHACLWAYDQMHVWLAFRRVWVSFVRPWGVNTEKLSEAALLRVYTERQRLPRAERLQMSLLPRCRHRSRPLAKSWNTKHICCLFLKSPQEEMAF